MTNLNEYFEGYACIFNQLDLGNDIILPEAFNNSLGEKTPNNISMLWQHDPNQPIGTWQEMFVDPVGLYVVGRLAIETRQARDVAFMIADMVIDGLSIGFKTRRAVQKAQKSARYIQDIDLWEISVVTFPMQLNARIKLPKQPINERIARATVALRA